MNLYTITLAGRPPVVFVEEDGRIIFTSDPTYAPIGYSLYTLELWCRECGRKLKREEMPAPADV